MNLEKLTPEFRIHASIANYAEPKKQIPKRPCPPKEVVAIACKVTGTTIDQLKSKSRLTEHVVARRLSANYIYQNHGFALAAIGKFVSRDHASVIHYLVNHANANFTNEPMEARFTQKFLSAIAEANRNYLTDMPNPIEILVKYKQ